MSETGRVRLGTEVDPNKKVIQDFVKEQMQTAKNYSLNQLRRSIESEQRNLTNNTDELEREKSRALIEALQARVAELEQKAQARKQKNAEDWADGDPRFNDPSK